MDSLPGAAAQAGPRRICVFCGSHIGSDPAFLKAASAVGAAIARHGYDLVYGGASVGLMGAVADAALVAGAEVIGVIPGGLFTSEVAHQGLTELRVVGSMHERKAQMHALADGFVALPGGLGTFEELLEMLTWAQIGLHAKPIGILDLDGFYSGLWDLLDRAGADGFLPPERRPAIERSDDPDALVGLVVGAAEVYAGLAERAGGLTAEEL